MTQFPKIPWKTVIPWSIIIGLAILLRHFFFIFFTTFIVSYSMRSVVVFFKQHLMRVTGLEEDNSKRFSSSRILEIGIVIVCFIGLLLSCYGIGSYFIPELLRQGQVVVDKYSSPKKETKQGFNQLLEGTVGNWLFKSKYGSVASPQYREAYEQFVEAHTADEVQREEFKELAVSEKREAFEKLITKDLVIEWRKGSFAKKIEAKAQEYIVLAMSSLGKGVADLVPKLLTFPLHLGLILLLSLFISLDVPKMKKGMERLSSSRIGFLYDEVKPGIVSFGLLIGRSFQAQACIAIANAFLTYLAIRFLGIQNEIFLSALVFVCSFVPVLGVVFSSVPIALMALVQPGGGFLLAIYAVVAILVIHFFETSVLNPRIVGSMLHIDPVLVLGILAISEHFFGMWGLLLGVPVFVYFLRIVILNEGVPGLIEKS